MVRCPAGLQYSERQGVCARKPPYPRPNLGSGRCDRHGYWPLPRLAKEDVAKLSPTDIVNWPVCLVCRNKLNIGIVVNSSYM